jgi:uncharacterized protein (TIGR03435 family)
MKAERFDIQATLPQGATKEQVPEMLQALLAERFKLAIHRDHKEHAVYALVVGKNGIKMKESEPDAPVKPAAEGEPAPPPPKGSMVINTGEGQVTVNQSTDKKTTTMSGPMGQMKMAMVDGQMRLEFAKMPMEKMAEMLSGMVDKPVVDMTELKGNYQVSLALSMEDMMVLARKNAAAAGIDLPMQGPRAAAAGADAAVPSAAASAPSSSVFAAVQQLGLKLDPRKAPVETIVIDHLEKAPTEN